MGDYLSKQVGETGEDTRLQHRASTLACIHVHTHLPTYM